MLTALALVLAAQEPAAPRNPLVRVATLSQEGLQGKAPAEIVAGTFARMNQAAAFKPDIVCLPEIFSRGEPEAVPGPLTQKVAAWAREKACYVICPLKVVENGRVTNSAVLLDRAGGIVGRYDKIRPTENELKEGVCPGADDPPVFDTDFGRIGIQICFDVNWRGQWKRLVEKGAKIVFFPSAFPAARQASTLAWLNQVFVVSSTMTRAASIFDVTGERIETSGAYRPWAGAVLPLGKRVFEIDFHVAKMRKIEADYGPRVRIDWFHDDDLVALASLDPQLTVDDLIGTYELTPHPAYMRRAQGAQDEAREKGRK